ncbi:MAG: hypothetical protein KIH08_05870 [Candidatus Freyarchaeota archaeon]|nr:hypothetical protein [Candidatus Jordarchaeia archaeon]MBS7269189.1 hypothetical protein [Candidatus Jordarchaeia archaeon]
MEDSNFKMLEAAPYSQPDTRAVTKLITDGVKVEENVYGPVFTAKVIDYALRLVSSQIGEEKPEGITNLDQLAEYLLSKECKLPPHWILLWAVFKTEKKFEGYQGAGMRLMDMGISRKVMESTNDLEGDSVNVENIFSKLRRRTIEMKVAPLQMGYKENGDGSISVLFQDCYFLDACQLALSEGLLKRADGRMVCGVFSLVRQYLKKATGREWDYTIYKFDKPNCIAKFFTV